MIKPADKPEKKPDARKKGAVLVVGGGIAGIQASLDLADAGQKVYMVEKTPAIGGNMARLDKTFPTNDCSMCILSPKVVEAGRHLNIDLKTLSEVKELKGDPGNFTARLHNKARYVDLEKCTGCGLCLEQCPTRNQPRFKARKPVIKLTKEQEKLVRRLIEEHGKSQKALLRVMQDINSTLRYLPENVLRYLADEFEVPLSTLYRIGTFYTAFSFEPRGKHTISVCLGTACHIKGAPRLIDELKRELAVDVGGTTPDQQFTLQAVRCIGCCSLAPAMTIGDRVFGNLKPAQIAKIIKDYSK